MKKIRYILEGILVWVAFAVFKLLGPDTASACGGWIGRTIGPKLAASRKARKNLIQAFPDMTEEEYNHTIADMWDNLGRVFGEYPHLKFIAENRMEVIGLENLTTLGLESSFVTFSGHLCNWELFSFFFNYHQNCHVSCVYRAPNNPYVEVLLDRCRNPGIKGAYLPKSRSGTKAMVKLMQEDGRVAILIDQKYNQGIPLDFFGRPAMTSTSLAALADKFDVPILPLQAERLKGCNFRITVHPSFKTEGSSDEAIMLEAHKMLESWITQKPAQWLWLHRRWG